MASCLSVCPEVRGALEEDGGVLLNLRTGRLFTMNRIGATIWRDLAGKNEFEPSDIFAFLANKYAAVDRERLRQDATGFLNRLLSQGFVSAGRTEISISERDRRASRKHLDSTRGRRHCGKSISDAQTRSKSQKVARRMRAFRAIVIAGWMLRRRGFYQLYRWIKMMPVAADTPIDSQGMEKLAEAVNFAANWGWRNPECLQKSAALVWLLRRSGVPAVMVIGCRLRPFESHAWVEVGGRVLNESAEVENKFLILDRW